MWKRLSGGCRGGWSSVPRQRGAEGGWQGSRTGVVSWIHLSVGMAHDQAVRGFEGYCTALKRRQRRTLTVRRILSSVGAGVSKWFKQVGSGPVSHGLQLQTLWVLPTAAARQHVFAGFPNGRRGAARRLAPGQGRRRRRRRRDVRRPAARREQPCGDALPAGGEARPFDFFPWTRPHCRLGAVSLAIISQ